MIDTIYRCEICGEESEAPRALDCDPLQRCATDHLQVDQGSRRRQRRAPLLRRSPRAGLHQPLVPVLLRLMPPVRSPHTDVRRLTASSACPHSAPRHLSPIRVKTGVSASARTEASTIGNARATERRAPMKPLLCAFFVIAACGAIHWPRSSLRPSPAAPAADQAQAVRGSNQFAADLYAHLRAQPGNLFFSPESISTAFAMTYAGASGDTASQMAQRLPFHPSAGSPASGHGRSCSAR